MASARIREVIEAQCPGALLESGRFGRSGKLALWIEMKAIADVARAVAQTPDTWLENLSAMQVDRAIVLTYFVRSWDRAAEATASVILRGSLLPKSPDALVDAPSVAGVWPSAEFFEREVSDLFGVRFTDAIYPEPPARWLLPPDWRGYPLRKEYKYPAEFGGIAHTERPHE